MMNSAFDSQRYGYTEKPDAGRNIVIATIMLGIIVGTGPWLLSLVLGSDRCHREWSTGGSAMNALMLLNMLQVGAGIAIVWWHSITVTGLKRAVISFVGVVTVAYLAEFGGTHWGWVFGPYHYTDKLPLHIFGVPLIICPAWTIILYPSFYMALYILPCQSLYKKKSLPQTLISGALIAAVGSVILTVSDLITDPMAISGGLWVYHLSGDYSAVAEPVSNFIGWFLTGVAVMGIYQLVVFTTPPERHTRSVYLDVYFPIIFYGFTFITDLGGVVHFGQYPDVAMLGSFSMGGIMLIAFAKLYLERLGGQPNLIGKGIS